MKEMREHKNFWDKNAGRYDRFMRKDQAAYEEMKDSPNLVIFDSEEQAQAAGYRKAVR